MGKKNGTKILIFFDNIFVRAFCRRGFRDIIYGDKTLLDGEMFRLGMVSTNLSRLFYAGAGNSNDNNVFFLNKVGEKLQEEQTQL